MNVVLSKSKYLSGLQCPKLLWTHYNQKHLIPPPDPATQWIFDQGHRIGKLAQQLAPSGVEVPFGSMPRTVATTRKFLTLRRPLYEASFLADDVYCRVDILRPVADDAWDVLEVKSGTSTKDINLHDLAIQRHAIVASGQRIRRLYLVHLNRDYVRHGDLDVRQLFTLDDVTERVEKLAPNISAELNRQQAVIAAPDPETPIGRQCDHPYSCALKAHCWAFLPENAVTTLHRAGQKAFAWLRDGHLRAVDLPQSQLSAAQTVQVRALREGKPQWNAAELRDWLQQLEYPLLFLDFEAFPSAIPLHDGTSPHQHVPFQASVHVLDAPGGQPSHLEYLAESQHDPRPGLIEFLSRLPANGSVVAFHKSYEDGILAGLAAWAPAQRDALERLRTRLVDLEEPFRGFAYYDPRQQGSTSLKAVLPALTGTGYAGDAIGDGSAAYREYLRVVYSSVPEAERRRVLADLREYCKKDTWAMVEILRVLESAAAA